MIYRKSHYRSTQKRQLTPYHMVHIASLRQSLSDKLFCGELIPYLKQVFRLMFRALNLIGWIYNSGDLTDFWLRSSESTFKCKKKAILLSLFICCLYLHGLKRCLLILVLLQLASEWLFDTLVTGPDYYDSSKWRHKYDSSLRVIIIRIIRFEQHLSTILLCCTIESNDELPFMTHCLWLTKNNDASWWVILITHHFYTNEITPKWEILIYFKNLVSNRYMLKVHFKSTHQSARFQMHFRYNDDDVRFQLRVHCHQCGFTKE